MVLLKKEIQSTPVVVMPPPPPLPLLSPDAIFAVCDAHAESVGRKKKRKAKTRKGVCEQTRYV